jgi:hypothetical protein
MVDGNYIEKGKEYKCLENIFDTHYVITKHGGVTITTEYSNRSFKTLGDIICEEIDKLDTQGLYVIQILNRILDKGWE